MRIGLYVSPAGAGSVDEVLARFARAEAEGFHTAWSGQIFEHDLLTARARRTRDAAHRAGELHRTDPDPARWPSR